ncbi:flagellar hook-length control protein FliK [Sedimenticola sp.]|uniref:flagellar hook-length control protein FliK n=1 Tax=Sedimenticola sp. TaxID=1940285 RepID=UPI003D128507
MNSASAGANLISSVLPSTVATGRPGSPGTSEASPDGIDFKELISSELLNPEAISQLKDILPSDQFKQLESLLSGGKDLPLSADIADAAEVLGNPSVLKWMLQQIEAGGEGKEIGTTLGSQSNAGVALTIADLKNMLLRQAAGAATDATGNQGKGGGASADTAGRSFIPATDNPAVSLLAKGELPAEAGLYKSALTAGELPANVSPGNGTVTVTPFSTMLAGAEQLSAQRAEGAAPLSIPIPVGDKGWDNVLSNRIMWMVGNQMQQASLQVTPRHLGPIDIQVSLQHDQTSVSFVAHNAAAKDALESAIPRLREMFADNNMQLINVDVGQRDTGGQKSAADMFGQTDSGGSSAGSGWHGGEADSTLSEMESVRVVVSTGLVDDYA